MKKTIYLIIVTLVLTVPLTALAISQSTNYKLYGGQADILTDSSQSSNYKAQVGGEPIAGDSASTNYKIEGGSAFSQGGTTEETPEETDQTQGGGGFSIIGDQTPPRIIDLEVVNINDNRATVLFRADEITVNYIKYGLPGSLDSQTFIEIGFRLEHSFILSGLSAETEYNFVVYSRDLNYNSAESIVYSFTTLSIGESLPGFEEIEMDDNLGDGDNEMIFVAPRISNVDHVDIYRSLDKFPDGTNEDELIFRGQRESFSDEDLVSGRIHYYTFIARDQDNGIVGIDYGSIFVPASGTVFLEPERLEPEEGSLIPEQLFDINLELDNSELDSTSDLVARVIFVSFGQVPTLVDLTFRILDQKGNELDIRKDEITVETERVFIQKFEDLDLPVGQYILELTTLYNIDVEDKFYADFKIKAESQFCYFLGLRCWIWYITTPIIIAIALILLIIVKKKKIEQEN